MDIPEISRVLFWFIYAAASGACLLVEAEPYLERMVLSTCFHVTRQPTATGVLDTRIISMRLLGSQAGEWYSQEGTFSVPWTIIANKVP